MLGVVNDTPSDSPSDSPSGPLDFATPDHDRARRCGCGEVVYGAGKTPSQTVAIVRALREGGQRCVLTTRASKEQVAALREAFGESDVDAGALGGAVMVGKPEVTYSTPIVIVAAGTSDLPVVEEAAMTCRALGHPVRLINDVGVAGLHRLLDRKDQLKGNALIVVAGMEGALPSVVGGLVDIPVIAVPTSVGYGASFGGVAALLGMLNSCASGVTVVNIDNGFGAAYAACQINRRVEEAEVGRR
ncbi:MAG: nickel pincer cofactor biosynthesis protein LarB [Algisphaera sp.]